MILPGMPLGALPGGAAPEIIDTLAGNYDTDVSGSNTAILSLPSYSAGDLMVLFTAMEGDTGAASSISGFTRHRSIVRTSSKDLRCETFSKIMAGTEGGTVTLTTIGDMGRSNGMGAVATALRGVSSLSFSTLAGSGSGDALTPLHTPSEDGLIWLATIWNTSRSLSGTPSGYTLLGTTAGPASNSWGQRLAGKVETLSSENPGNFTVTFGGSWETMTMALW